MRSKTLLVLLFPALLPAQKSPFSTSAQQPIELSYNVDTTKPIPPSATTFTQFVALKSAQPQTYQITPASNPQWLQYAVASSSATNCSAVPDSAYRSSVSSPATGNTINLCIRGMSTPPLTHGNYLGTITIGPASAFFVPFRLLVELSSFPNGFLQLSTPDGSFFGGGTISVAVQNGSLALSINTVVCNVFDPNSGSQTDLKDSLAATALIPNTFTPANWVVLSFSNNSKSPSNLSISIDPAKAKNQPDLSAVIVINSLSPNQGQDFVFLQPDLITTTLPALSATPNPLNLTAVAGSTTFTNQTVMVSASGGTVSYAVAAATSDGGNWLQISQPNGTTPGVFAVSLDASHLAAKTYTGTVTITASGASNSPLAIPVTALVTAAPSGPPGQTLISGTPIVVNLPGVFAPTLFNGASSDQIVVPQGATSLQLQAQTTGDVGLYARFGADVALDANGQVVSDASAPAAGGGNRSITLTPGSSPPLRSGLWFIALSNLLNAPAQVTLTATVATSPPAQNNLTLSPGSLMINAVTGSATLIANTINVASTTAGLSFTAAVTSGQWLSVQNVSGTTPGTFSAVIDPTRLNPGANAGSIQVSSGGASNSPVTLAVTVQASSSGPLPSITANGILNAASNTAPIAPGSWVSIYGANLSPQVPSGIDWSGAITNNKLPLVLAGVSVTINNNPAAISFVNNNQINAQAPNDSNRGPVNVVVTTSNGVSSPGVVTLQPIAPALFMNGATTLPAAQRSDFSTISSTNPARPGDSVILYGTGFGPTNPPFTTGVVISVSAALTNAVTATVGNIPAQVDFAGIIAAGLYQINIRVPASAGAGNLPLVLSVNGLQTQGNVFLPVAQ
jgi:uncharacterized protein (TIGR03437 family)